jgi:cathepsin X
VPLTFLCVNLSLCEPAQVIKEGVSSVVISPLPHTYLKPEDVPASYNPNDVDGVTLTTTDLNQHIPQYCGSCWAHAAMSSIADRIKIASKGLGRDVIPAIQVMIDCGDAGTCNGGDSNAANEWVHKNGGIPDITCQQYQAKNMKCATPEQTCMNCSPGGKGCVAVTDYPKIQVSEYGSVSGEAEMKAEIFARGPVSCYIDAGPLEDYKGGVNMYEGAKGTDHAIQIAGWGTDNGVDYWLGRNSWGTYWGEHGWFRISSEAYKPKACYWAVPVYNGTGVGGQ